MIFVGDDWAEDHHDVYVMSADGARLASRRLPEGLAGIRSLHEVIADHAGEPGEVVIGIETDRGLWVQAMGVAGYQVFAINPLAVARSTISRWSKNPPATSTACCASKNFTGNTLPFYNGSNPLILDALTAGASGWCTVAPNLRPQPCLDLYAATQAGDYAAAKAIYEDLSPLLRFIVAGGLPTTVKAGLNLLGTHVGDPRPPLLPLDEAGLDEMRSLLID
jgi:hypothetical protein